MPRDAGGRALAAHIGRLKHLRERLNNRVTFFSANHERYRDMARTVILTELMILRPENISMEEWSYTVGRLAAKVSSTFYNGDEVGLSIWLDNRNAQQEKIPEVEGPLPIFAMDTVLAWVRAGESGDPLGKVLDERDTGNSSLEIAQRVWWALYTGRSLHSAEHIREFMTGRAFEIVSSNLDGILAIWRQTIGAVIIKDWHAWFRALIKAD